MSARARGEIEIEIKIISGRPIPKRSGRDTKCHTPMKINRPETDKRERGKAAVLNTRSQMEFNRNGRARAKIGIAGH